MSGAFSNEKIAQEFLAFMDETMKGVNKMFDQEKMTQTWFDLAKNYTETTMQLMKTSMEHYEKTLDAMVKQGIVAQAEGQKMLMDWMNRSKQGQQQYWNQMDENLKKMETFFSQKKTK